MATCCGSSGRCTCRVTAGPGVTVDGTGSAGAPYVISSSGSPTALTTVDSPTVDVEVTGSGSPGDPYAVTADVILDPAPPAGGTNLIQTGPDGLFVECEQVRGCTSAGDGIDYDPATGVIEAQISADAGNQTAIGGDGGLFTPAAAPAGLGVTDTPTVDLTLAGTGAPGDPYAVTADVILDPAPPGGGTNLIQEGADGLYVECTDVRTCFSAGDGAVYDATTGEIGAKISADAGNTTVIGGDGGIYTPAPAVADSTVLQVEDSQTVDTTLIGTGTAADPYVVGSSVILDPAPPGGGTNLIETGPDGLYVECADVRTCFSAGDGVDYDPATGVIESQISADAGNQVSIGGDGGLYAPAGDTTVVAADSTTVDVGVTGAGDAGDPYTVTASVILDPAPPGGGTNILQAGPDGLFVECAEVRTCFTAGDGIDYDPATGVIEAQISGDAGNTTVIGGDGGLYTPAPAGTALQATDTPTLNATVTGTGTTGDPFIVSGDVIVAPEDNGVEITPAGLLVAPSADAGNRLAFGADDRLFVPPTEVGCGLQGDGSAGAPIEAFPIAGDRPWATDWTCDAVANSTLHCDPNTGALWTPPEHSSAAVTIQQNHPMGAPVLAPSAGFIVINNTVFSEGTYTADSLSLCRGMSFQTQFDGHVEVTWTAGTTFNLGYAIQINGGALAVRVGHSRLQTGGIAGHERFSFGVSQSAVLAPHTGYVVRVFPAAHVVAGQLTINQWITDTQLLIVTR